MRPTCATSTGIPPRPTTSTRRSGSSRTPGSQVTTVKAKMPKRTHGLSRTSAYKSWRAMLSRCLDPKAKSFQSYGGAGIKVCHRWLDFRLFLDDMGHRPPGTTLDRIDSTRGYEPGNCRWADWKTQLRNRPTFVRLVTFRGKTQCASAWEEELGFASGLVYGRLRRGWTVEAALATPVLPFTEAGRRGGGSPHNKRTRQITYKGRTQTLTQWAHELQVSRATLAARVYNGWSPGETLDVTALRR